MSDPSDAIRPMLSGISRGNWIGKKNQVHRKSSWTTEIMQLKLGSPSHLFRLARRRRCVLRHLECVLFVGCIIASTEGNRWCSGLVVPTDELRQVYIVSVLVCGNPLLCRDRVAIVSLFVQLEASHEAIVSQDIPKNRDYLSSYCTGAQLDGADSLR